MTKGSPSVSADQKGISDAGPSNSNLVQVFPKKTYYFVIYKMTDFLCNFLGRWCDEEPTKPAKGPWSSVEDEIGKILF